MPSPITNLLTTVRKTAISTRPRYTFKKATDIDQNFVQAYFNLARILTNPSEYDQAIRNFETALEIDPDFAECHYWFSKILISGKKLEADGTLIKKPDPERAERHLRKAIKINPKFYKAYYRLGLLLKDHEKYAESFENLSKAIKINPKFAEAHYHLAVLLMDEKSRKSFQAKTPESSTSSRDPPPKNLPRERKSLGATRRRDRFLDGLTAEALRHLEKALACEPNHILPNRTFQRLFEQREFSKVGGLLEEALASRQDQGEVFFLMARLLKLKMIMKKPRNPSIRQSNSSRVNPSTTGFASEIAKARQKEPSTIKSFSKGLSTSIRLMGKHITNSENFCTIPMISIA